MMCINHYKSMISTRLWSWITSFTLTWLKLVESAFKFSIDAQGIVGQWTCKGKVNLQVFTLVSEGPMATWLSMKWHKSFLIFFEAKSGPRSFDPRETKRPWLKIIQYIHIIYQYHISEVNLKKNIISQVRSASLNLSWTTILSLRGPLALSQCSFIM